MITNKQLREIIKIIREHVGATIYLTTGKTPDDVDIEDLKSRGIIASDVSSELIREAYVYGILTRLTDEMTTATMMKKVREAIESMEFSKVESDTIEWLKTNSANYMKGLGNRIEEKTMRVVHDAKREEVMREAYRRTITAGAELHQTRSQIVTALRDFTGDFHRDMERVVNTELHNAQQEGRAQFVRDHHGEDATVVIRPNPDACELCKKIYLDEDGKPKPYKLSYLDEVTNVGRKKDEIIAHPGKPTVHPHCYHKDTEVYTRDGWKLIRDVAVGEECLTLKPEDLDLEWSRVTNTISHKAETLIEFKSRTLSIGVTPEHRMFYFKNWPLKKGKIVPDFTEAKMLPKTAIFYRSSEWKGEETGNITIGKYEIEPEVFCKFMAWYLSDGSCTERKDGKKQVTIFQQDKPVELMIDLSDFPKELWCSRRNFGFYDNDIYKYVKQFGKAHEKFIPEVIKCMKPEYIRTFLDCFRKADGYESDTAKRNEKWRAGNFRNQRVYFSSSKRLADDLGELMIKAGSSPSFTLNKTKGVPVKHRNGTYCGNHDVWAIRENYRRQAYGENIQREVIEYNDMVYCVEVEKNHTIWVRKNGKAFWCGNCQCQLLAFDPKTQEVDALGRIVFKPKPNPLDQISEQPITTD